MVDYVLEVLVMVFGLWFEEGTQNEKTTNPSRIDKAF
jgi:hypothetical protein